MVTCIFIYLAVLCLTIQGLTEEPQNVTISTNALRKVIDHFATNDTKFKEFVAIFDYYLNLTLIEKANREEVTKLASVHFAVENETQQGHTPAPLEWKNAIKVALNEVNTTLVNETTKDITEYVNIYVRKPEEIKDSLQSYRKYEDKDFTVTDSSAANEYVHGQNTTHVNEFWDIAQTRRIFKGKKTKIKLFPFMASVQLFERFSCGGSIISSDLVITAASCLQLAWNNRFFRENPAFLSVRIGSHFFAVGGEVIPVMEVYFHPTYVPKTLHNNLAVMRLERHISFRHRNTKRIRIDTNPAALPENTPGITLIGWGAKTHANKVDNALVNRIHMTVLDFYDLESCSEIYGKEYVTRNNFCAGFITKGEGACNLDAGDPGVSDGRLVGVVSFGSPVCGRADTPTVFTKVGYYADWIEDIMEQDVPHIKKRTTTQRPFNIYAPIKLFGSNSEERLSIVPLREGEKEIEATENVKSEIITNEHLADVLKIQPITETGLSKEIELTESVKSEIIPNEHLADVLRIKPISETLPVDLDTEMESMDHSQSTEDNEPAIKSPWVEKETKKEWVSYDHIEADVSTMNPVTRITKLFNFDSASSVSHEIDEILDGTEQPTEISKQPEINFDTLDPSEADITDFDVSTIKSVTIMGNFDPEEPSDNFDLEEHIDKMTKLPAIDHTFQKGSEINTEYDLHKKENKTLRYKHFIADIFDEANSRVEEIYSPTDKNKPNKKERTSKKKKNSHSNTLSIDADDDIIEFGIIEEQHDAIRESLTPHAEEEMHEIQLKTDAHSELTDKLIKNEIEKLIKELEASSELKPTEEEQLHDVSENNEEFEIGSEHKKQKANKNEDNTKSKDSILAFLYLSDNEKEIQRQDFLARGSENLSIDPEPFKPNNITAYDLIGKSEIYQIFSEVLKTVVNKTLN